MKKVIFWFLLLLLNLLFIEVCSFSIFKLKPSIFDQYQEYLSHIAFKGEQMYSNFIKNSYHQVQGWQTPKSITINTFFQNKKISMSYNEYGARLNKNNLSKTIPWEILVVGDSFTHGDEVDDFYTYPSNLERMDNVTVHNYGVGGFGPYQSFLRFKEKIDNHPSVKIVILGIMHENIRRLVNSFRPVYYLSTPFFGFKPYVNRDGFVDNPNSPEPLDYKEVIQLTASAYRNDYWGSSLAEFPFTRSLGKVIFSNQFKLRSLTFFNSRILGNAYYSGDYSNAYLTERLRQLIDLYIEFAEMKDVFPIVVFIPMNKLDIQGATLFVRDLRVDYTDRALLIDVSDADIDWNSYNIKSTVHPTEYGYSMIAKAIYEKLSSFMDI